MYFNHIHPCFYFIILLHFCKLVFLRGSFFQPRPQGAFPWLWEKRPGDEVVFLLGICGQCRQAEKWASNEVSANG